MNYLSTSGKYNTSLLSATINPVAADGSLYIPEYIPTIPAAFINNMSEMTTEEIAFAVTNTLLGGDIPGEVLRSVVHQAFGYKMPIVGISNNLYVAELFHGPTLSYKDIGAKFITGIMGYLLRDTPGLKLGIVSTAGNTGAALASTFRQFMPADSALLVLYPSGKMNRAQISQFTTPGNKTLAVEVTGTVEDCRRIATSLHDEIAEMRSDVVPLMLNSANILRIIPQVAVFFYIYASLMREHGKFEKLRVVVPSGNMTNLTAALIARKMGLSKLEIVAATAPDSTYAKAMAAGPSPVNHDRAMAIDRNFTLIEVSDRQIADTILESSAYTPDPHTATALSAAKLLENPEAPTVIISTAHPAKSLDIMTSITGRAMEMPLQLTNFMHNTRPAARIAPSVNALKKYLVNAFDQL